MLCIKNANFLPYDIHLETSWHGLASSVEQLSLRFHRICIVTDTNVSGLYLKAVHETLSSLPAEIYEYIIPAGEENKTLDQIQSLYAFLIKQGFDRQDLLIALGGGVIGDMTGFAAATYLRGIDFIQIPTTLLAQVDSSIGGKTGVDFSSYKNMVGAFKQPRLVYMNMAVLQTLPERQLASGMAEVIKHGCIRNATYFSGLQNLREAILTRDLDALAYVVLESLKIKQAIVEADPFEQGERALLNFGHTLGHALEKESGFLLSHGEGVSLGCIAAGWISMQRGSITAEDLHRMEETFSMFGLPIRYSAFVPKNILEAVKHDKKMDGNTIRFILLHPFGNAVVDRHVTTDELYAALGYIWEDKLHE